MISERKRHHFKNGPKPIIRAAVWEIFQKKPGQPNVAVCKICTPEVTLKMSRSSTSSLRNHANSFHKTELKAADERYVNSTKPKENIATETANKIKQRYKFGSSVCINI